MDTPPAQDPFARPDVRHPDVPYSAPPLPDERMPEPPPPRRRMSRGARIGWVVGVIAVVVLIAVGAYVQLTANTSFDAAEERLTQAIDEADAADEALTATVDESAGSAGAAQTIVGSAPDDLVDPAVRTVLADAAAATTAEITVADEALAAPIGASEEKPFWPWELLGTTTLLDERTDAAIEATDAMTDAEAALTTADTVLADAATALYATVAPAATALEAANVSAISTVVLDFRDAAEAAAGQTELGSGAAVAFTTYAQTAEAMKASMQSELAEKAGPLLATRLEIEEFARSIAGGVVLDFDWAPIVAGTGGREGIGGTATWNTVRGGFSTITLSNSVAETWPDANARALVAHEVGHSITSKCSDKFDSADQAANEEWATAWAISMGYTAEGNGTQAYGPPSQAMIDIAATCR